MILLLPTIDVFFVQKQRIFEANNYFPINWTIMCISRQNLNGNLFVIDYTITTQMNQSSKTTSTTTANPFSFKLK